MIRHSEHRSTFRECHRCVGALPLPEYKSLPDRDSRWWYLNYGIASFFIFVSFLYYGFTFLLELVELSTDFYLLSCMNLKGLEARDCIVQPVKCYKCLQKCFFQFPLRKSESLLSEVWSCLPFLGSRKNFSWSFFFNMFKFTNLVLLSNDWISQHCC